MAARKVKKSTTRKASRRQVKSHSKRNECSPESMVLIENSIDDRLLPELEFYTVSDYCTFLC